MDYYSNGLVLIAALKYYGLHTRKIVVIVLLYIADVVDVVIVLNKRRDTTTASVCRRDRMC